MDDTKNGLSALRQNISLLESAMEDGNDPAVILAETRVTTTDTDAPGLKQDSISVEQQLTQAKRQEQLLKEELDKQQAKFDELFDTAQLINEENRTLEHKHNLFSVIRQRLDQIYIERKVRDVIATIEVLSEAFVSSRPYSDSRILLTGIVLALCLVMDSAIVLLLRIRIGKDKKDR